MVGGAAIEAKGKEGVSFVLDLTGRKRAEEEACESERRYREVQMELEHANRVDTIGQLAASIAHQQRIIPYMTTTPRPSNNSPVSRHIALALMAHAVLTAPRIQGKKHLKLRFRSAFEESAGYGFA